MALFETNTSSLAKTYYDKWLSVATDGNVSYAAEYDTCFNRTRVRFTCKCGSMLELKPSDMMDMAVAVPYEAQEFVKLHKHSNIEEKRYCPTCYSEVLQQWNRYLCMKGCHPVSKGWDKSETLDAVPAAGIPGATYTFTYTAKAPPSFKPGQIFEIESEVAWPTPPKNIVWDQKTKTLKLETPKRTGRRFR